MVCSCSETPRPLGEYKHSLRHIILLLLLYFIPVPRRRSREIHHGNILSVAVYCGIISPIVLVAYHT